MSSRSLAPAVQLVLTALWRCIEAVTPQFALLHSQAAARRACTGGAAGAHGLVADDEGGRAADGGAGQLVTYSQ